MRYKIQEKLAKSFNGRIRCNVITITFALERIMISESLVVVYYSVGCLFAGFLSNDLMYVSGEDSVKFQEEYDN